MQMRHINALFMLFGSKDDLCYITDCDVFTVKWKPEMLRLMNTAISYIGVRLAAVVGFTVVTRCSGIFRLHYLPSDPRCFASLSVCRTMDATVK